MVSNIPPLPPDEEDAIIHSRITNDERALRRVVKKFSTYTTVAYSQADPPGSDQSNSVVEDAREAFLLELSSFSLQLKKAVMVCEAEARQVEEYYREKQRIEDERGSLKGQIEQLKTFLEHAQVERKRKIEYDNFADKINTLPCRAELERSIQLLENDMAAIRADQEAQGRHLQTQRASLVSIISDLGSLRLMAKDTEAEPSHPGTPDPDVATSEADASRSSLAVVAANEESDREEGEAEEIEKHQEDGSAPPSIIIHDPPSNSDDDIEMGELAEEREPVRGKKKLRLRREELEEGEASDESSELSDPPDD